MTTTTNNSSNRLANIVTRQRSTRARDFMFAAFVAFAAVIGVTTVKAAAHNWHSDNVATIAQK